MTSADLSRPTAGEHIPYYSLYIDLVPDGDILATLERQIGKTANAWGALSPEQAQWRPAPGEWNALEILGHLADAERLFGYRAMRIARADPTMWESIEVDDYVTNGDF